ncbi:MAG: 30S ribosome-binding factor RbfA [Candidatus Adiutricales bacterium]
MGTKRVSKVQGLILEEISRLLLLKAKDPRLKDVTVTGVDLSPDLKKARVYYNLLEGNADRDQIAKVLEKSSSFFRREVGRSAGLKFTPEIIFIFDPSQDYGRHMDEVFRRLKESGKP